MKNIFFQLHKKPKHISQYKYAAIDKTDKWYIGLNVFHTCKSYKTSEFIYNGEYTSMGKSTDENIFKIYRDFMSIFEYFRLYSEDNIVSVLAHSNRESITRHERIEADYNLEDDYEV